jgi:hypothetical protein
MRNVLYTPSLNTHNGLFFLRPSGCIDCSEILYRCRGLSYRVFYDPHKNYPVGQSTAEISEQLSLGLWFWLSQNNPV